MEVYRMGRASKAVLTLAGKFGWRVNGSAVAGMIDGYWFCACQAKPGAAVIVSTAISGLKTLEYRNLAQEIEAATENYSLLDMRKAGNSLEFTIRGTGKSDDAAIRAEKLINDLVSKFKKMGMPSGCSFCDAEGFHAFYRVGEEIINICPECASRVSIELKAMDGQGAEQGSYYMGIMGALLGALIGSLIWLGISQLGFYASIVGYFMAFLSYKGYKLLGGRIGSYTPAIIIASVFLGVLIAQIADTALELIQYMETGFSMPLFGFSFILAIRGFFDNELFNVGKIWLNLGLGLLFAFLGSYRMVSGIRKETSRKQLNIEKLP